MFKPVSHCLTAPHIAGGAGSSVLLHNVEKDDKTEIRNSDIYGTVSILIDTFPDISLSTVLHRLNLELMLVLESVPKLRSCHRNPPSITEHISVSIRHPL